MPLQVSLSPVFTIVALVSIFLTRRELHAGFLVAGLTINDVLSTYIKRLALSIPILVSYSTRPPHCDRQDGGLPSSHAQFVFFLLFYAFHLPSSFPHQLFLLILLALNAILVSTSRVYLAYHTSLQVVAGALLGAILGWSFGRITSLYLVPKTEVSSIGIKLHLKDSLHTDHLLLRERDLAVKHRSEAEDSSKRETKAKAS